jgi:hypothetical protein
LGRRGEEEKKTRKEGSRVGPKDRRPDWVLRRRGKGIGIGSLRVILGFLNF